MTQKPGVKQEIHGSEPKAFKTARKLLSPCYNTMFSQNATMYMWPHENSILSFSPQIRRDNLTPLKAIATHRGDRRYYSCLA